MRQFRIICLVMCVSLIWAVPLFADTPLWEITPIEILNGKTELHTPLVTAENQNLSQWQITSNMTANMTGSSDTKLWRETVAKLTLSNPYSPTAKSVTLAPPQPINISGAFNSIDIWIRGLSWSMPMSIKIIDSVQHQFTIPFLGGTSEWSGQSLWWNMAHAKVPSGVVFPARFVSFTIDGVTAANYTFYWDALSFYQDPMNPITISPEAAAVVMEPTTEYTILPSCYHGSYTNSVSESNGTYTFTYQGSDGTIEYIYTPSTGTLSDIRARYNGGSTFYPAQNGGLYANVTGVSFSPSDSEITVKLVKNTLKTTKNRLLTQWCWFKNNKKVTFKLDLEIKGKSLIIETSSPKADVTDFVIGNSSGTPDPVLVKVPFYDVRWEEPSVLYSSNGLFVSAILDWWNTNASWMSLEDASPWGPNVLGVAILSGDSARYNGGSTYGIKSDGQRNPLHERLFITVSPDITEVFPNTPDPVSEYCGITKDLVCCTRQHPFGLTPDAYWVDYELSFWQKMKRYGVEHVLIHLHEDIWRTPHGNVILLSDVASQCYGDVKLQEFATGIMSLGYLLGPYVNHQNLHPLRRDFSNDAVAWDQYYTWRPAYNSFSPKTSFLVDSVLDYAPIIKAKFSFNAVYLDEITNSPPWGRVDYDSRTPGTGKLVTVFKDFARAIIVAKDVYGPVWSEGTAEYMWAGLTDLNYAQISRPDSPTLVDFKLLKINPLQNSTGVSLSEIPGKSLDWKLATQIIYGSTGHLWDKEGENQYGLYSLPTDRIQDLAYVFKSYFMMQQLQGYYANLVPVEIKYNSSGTLVSTSIAVATGAYEASQVYTRYPNDLEVYVNRNQSQNWTVTVGGKSYLLPPNGYVAYKENEILEYSCLVYSFRVDYVRGLDYTYCDGHGRRTVFDGGKITATRSYLIKFGSSSTWITPMPFTATETIRLQGYTSVSEIVAYDEYGNIMPVTVSYTLSGGKLDVQTQAGIFKYEIRI